MFNKNIYKSVGKINKNQLRIEKHLGTAKGNSHYHL